MELSNTVHRLNDFYEELDQDDCHEMILIAINWENPEKTVPAKMLVNRTMANPVTSLVPLSMALCFAAKEMNCTDTVVIKTAFGTVTITATPEAMPIEEEA